MQRFQDSDIRLLWCLGCSSGFSCVWHAAAAEPLVETREALLQKMLHQKKAFQGGGWRECRDVSIAKACARDRNNKSRCECVEGAAPAFWIIMLLLWKANNLLAQNVARPLLSCCSSSLPGSDSASAGQASARSTAVPFTERSALGVSRKKSCLTEHAVGRQNILAASEPGLPCCLDASNEVIQTFFLRLCESSRIKGCYDPHPRQSARRPCGL